MHRCCRWPVLFGVLAILVAAVRAPGAPATRPAPPATRDVQASLDRAKAFLYAAQTNGNWEAKVPRRDKQDGGVTALAVYALLASGESERDPRLAAAIDFLKKHDTEGMYALAMRAQVWRQLKPTDEIRKLMRRDLALLLAGAKNVGFEGLYRYTVDTPDRYYDHSVSQFGVLGVWALADAGMEIPLTYWTTVDAQWRKNQLTPAGWSYRTGHPSYKDPTGALTAAGIATLYITQEMIATGAPAVCKGNPRDADLDRATRWIATNFDTLAFDDLYVLYGIERIGLASGRKYLGDRDWYAEGAARLLTAQRRDGSWARLYPVVPDTSLGILFLLRGRAPVVMNKLEYSTVGAGNKPAVANWNQRPRDAANITRWIGKQAERELRWQTVTLDGRPEDLHDSAILYIAGSGAVAFSPEDQTKLRRYVEQGGMIVANADCGDVAFANSIRRLGSTLFPVHEFRELPGDHVIYNTVFFRNAWKTKPAVLGLSNGVRELIVLIPSADPARNWQARSHLGADRLPLSELMANLYFYSVDRDHPRLTGQSHLIAPDPSIQPTRTVRIARIKYGGNWDPEPAGWTRLAAHLLNTGKVRLDVAIVDPAKDKLDGFRFAHLTGTDRFRLDDVAKAALTRFVADGGTLIVDSAGGADAFAASAQPILAEIGGTGADAALSRVVAADDPLLADPRPEIAYRRMSTRKLGARPEGARFRVVRNASKLAILFSPEDLSAGLVGNDIDGVHGYTPASATEIMSRVLLTP